VVGDDDAVEAGFDREPGVFPPSSGP
jgi:hypothetical protein